jgi:translation initiation factor IF-1
MSTEALNSAANELVSLYLIPGVETEVNISDQMKKNIIRMTEGDDVASKQEEFFKHLDRAQNEVMMILAMGAFPRFMKSTYFVQYKIKSKQRETEQADQTDNIREPERA